MPRLLWPRSVRWGLRGGVKCLCSEQMHGKSVIFAGGAFSFQCIKYHDIKIFVMIVN